MGVSSGSESDAAAEALRLNGLPSEECSMHRGLNRAVPLDWIVRDWSAVCPHAGRRRARLPNCTTADLGTRSATGGGLRSVLPSEWHSEMPI